MFLLIFTVWLILNGTVTVEICLFGLVISAALFWFICHFMDYSLKKELLYLRLTPFLLRYAGILIGEVFLANVNVLKLALSPRLQPEPALIYFNVPLSTGAARMLLANSITLTPGTITISVEGNRFCVHCLDRELGEGIETSVFIKLLKQMEEIQEEWMQS